MVSWLSKVPMSGIAPVLFLAGLVASGAQAQLRSFVPPTAVMIPIETERSVSAGSFVESESWIGPFDTGVMDQIVPMPCDVHTPPELCETGSAGAAGWQDSLISRNAVLATGGASAGASSIAATIDGTSSLSHAFTLSGWTDYEADGTLETRCDSSDGSSRIQLEAEAGSAWTPVFEVVADCVAGGATTSVVVRQKGLLPAGTYRLVIGAGAVSPSDGQNQAGFDVEFRISAGSPFRVPPGSGTGPGGPSPSQTQPTLGR